MKVEDAIEMTKKPIEEKGQMSVYKLKKTEVEYDVLARLGVLNIGNTGWTRELRIVSWSGREPKFDIRYWSPNDVHIGKGISFSLEEIRELKKILNECNDI